MSAPPGWYPDPDQLPGKRYWDGVDWTGQYREPPNHAAAVGVIVLAGVGLIMSMQSVSLLSGSGTIWIGVAITAVAVAAAFMLKTTQTVRVVAAALLIFALGNALYMEKQMNDKRNEISRMFQ